MNLWRFFKEKSDQSKNVSISDRLKIFWSIFDGLEFIHSNNLKHLDIKLSNVMINVDKNTGNFDGKNCVITDFGIGAKKDKETGMAGTPGFANPEQLISDQVGLESDLYSLGRLMPFLFAEWKSSWTILYQPIQAISAIQLTSNDKKILRVIRKLLKVCLAEKISIQCSF